MGRFRRITSVVSAEPVRVACVPRGTADTNWHAPGSPVQLAFSVGAFPLGTWPVASAADALVLIELLATPRRLLLQVGEDDGGDLEALLSIELPTRTPPIALAPSLSWESRLGAPDPEHAVPAPRAFPVRFVRTPRSHRRTGDEFLYDAKDMLVRLVPTVAAVDATESAIDDLLASL